MSEPINDRQLLERFVQTRAPEAFRELVERHTNLVWASAYQRLGDAHAAQDVTQSVFVALALKAAKLRPETPLAGWLFKATRFACAMHRRSEQRRKEREMEGAQRLENATDPTAALWQELQPHLARALDALPAKDREAILLRFYRQGSYREVAAVLRTNADSARKRVDRALEKLRLLFARRGISLSAITLSGVLATRAAQAAPAGLAAGASATALAALNGSLATTASTLLLAKSTLTMFAWNSAKTASLIAAAVLAAGGSLYLLALQSSPEFPTAAPPALSDAPSPNPFPSLPYLDPEPPVPVMPAPSRDTLAEQIKQAMREPNAAQRRARLRAILAGVELPDLEWANGVIRQLAPLSTQPLGYPAGGDCRSCHTSGTPKGDFNQCAVNPRLNEPMQALLFRWGQLAPQAALGQASQLPEARLAWFAEVNALDGWIATDPAAAAQFIWQNNKQLSAGQNTLMKAVAHWAQTDPAVTLAFLANLPATEQLPYLSALGGGWAQTDPAAAASWAATLADPRVCTTAYQAIAYVWTVANPAAAGQWLNSLPAGRDRDLVVSIFSRTLAGAAMVSDTAHPPDPQLATLWAATIADAVIRAEAYQMIVTAWARTDRAAATAWVNQLPAGPDRDRAWAALSPNNP